MMVAQSGRNWRWWLKVKADIDISLGDVALLTRKPQSKILSGLACGR